MSAPHLTRKQGKIYQWIVCQRRRRKKKKNQSV